MTVTFYLFTHSKVSPPSSKIKRSDIAKTISSRSIGDNRGMVTVLHEYGEYTHHISLRFVVDQII